MKFFNWKSYFKAIILVLILSLSNIQSLHSEASVFKKFVNQNSKNNYNVSRNKKTFKYKSNSQSIKIEDFSPTEEILNSIESGCWLVIRVDEESTKYETKNVCDESRDMAKIKSNEKVFKSRKDTYIISKVNDMIRNKKYTTESFDKEDNEDENLKISDTKISIDELPVSFLKNNSDFYLIELPENSVAIYSKNNYLGKRRIIDQEMLKDVKTNEGIKMDINIKSIILSTNSSLKITLKSNIKSKSTYLFYNDVSKVNISSIISYSPESKVLNLIGTKILLNIKKIEEVDFLSPIIPSDNCVLTLNNVISSEELKDEYDNSLICVSNFSKQINMHTLEDKSILNKSETSKLKTKKISTNSEETSKTLEIKTDEKVKEKLLEKDEESDDEDLGSYNDEELKNLKKIRMNTKSIIKDKETVLLTFSEVDFKGKLSPIFGNVLNTEVEGLNNIHSYMILETNCLILFEEANYIGNKRMYCFNVNDMKMAWTIVESFGSIILGPKTKVKLYSDINFKGESITITKSLSNLSYFIDKIQSFKINGDDTNIELSKKNIPENCILLEHTKKNQTDLLCKDNFKFWDSIKFHKIHLPESVNFIIVKVKQDNILLPKAHYIVGKDGKVNGSTKIFKLDNFEYVEDGCAIFTKNKNFGGKIRKYCGAVNEFDLYGYSSIKLGLNTKLYAYYQYSFLGKEVLISEDVMKTDQINLFKSISLQSSFSYSKYIKNYGNFVSNFFMGTALGLRASTINFIDPKKANHFEQCANIFNNKETNPINREVFDKNFITDLFDHYKLGETTVFKTIFKIKDFAVGQVYRGMHLYYKYYCGLKNFIISKMDLIVKILIPLGIVNGGISISETGSSNPTRRKFRKTFVEWKNKAINKIELYKDTLLGKITNTVFMPIKNLIGTMKDKFVNNKFIKKITESKFLQGLVTFLKCLAERISTISTLVFKVMRLVSIIEKLIAITGASEGGGAALIVLFGIDFILSQICDYRKYLVIKGYIETGFYYLLKHKVEGEKKVAFTYFGMALGMLIETVARNQSYTEAIWQVVNPFSKFGIK